VIERALVNCLSCLRLWAKHSQKGTDDRLVCNICLVRMQYTVYKVEHDT